MALSQQTGKFSQILNRLSGSRIEVSQRVKVEQLCRNAVTTIREGLGVTEPVDVKVEESAVDPEAAELF